MISNHSPLVLVLLVLVLVINSHSTNYPIQPIHTCHNPKTVYRMSLTDPSARLGSGGSGSTSHGQNEYEIPKPGRLNLYVTPFLPLSLPYSFILPLFPSLPLMLQLSRLKLTDRRETRAERNERIRKSAEKEFRDHEAAIRKANKTHFHHNSEKRGRESRSEYTDEELRILESLGPGDDFFISRGVGHLLHDDGDDEGDYSGPNVFRGGDDGVGVEASLAGRHMSNQGRMPDVRIPSRYAHTHTHTHGQAHASTSAASTLRSTFTFTHTTSGTNQRSNISSFQEYNQQSEREYRDGIYRQMEWVRSHRAKQQFQAEAQERKAAQEAEYMRQILEAEKEERRREKREKERRKRDRERAFEEGEEGRKKRRGSTPIFDHSDAGYEYMAQAGASSKSGAREVDLRRRKERERYLSRWKSLLSTDNNDEGDGDGIIETELSYQDIPWPTYQKSNLDKISIKTFLSSFTSNSISSQSQKEQERKIYREAIRNFHPDRFNSKVLPRVREGERDKVKEGMEVCSRVLTGLISDNSASR